MHEGSNFSSAKIFASLRKGHNPIIAWIMTSLNDIIRCTPVSQEVTKQGSHVNCGSDKAVSEEAGVFRKPLYNSQCFLLFSS